MAAAPPCKALPPTWKGACPTAITGNTAQQLSGGGILNIASGGTSLAIAVQGCTISGNSSGFGGGGLASFNGTTTLTKSTVDKNSAGYNGGGGGLLFVGNTTTLTDCTISGNSAGPGPLSGGGDLQPEYGTTTLTHCSISSNSAGSSNGGPA